MAEAQAWRRVSELQGAFASVSAVAAVLPFKDAVNVMTKGTEQEKIFVQGFAGLTDSQRASMFKLTGAGPASVAPFPLVPRPQAALQPRLGGDRGGSQGSLCFHCNTAGHTFRHCAALAFLYQQDPVEAERAWTDYSSRVRGSKGA